MRIQMISLALSLVSLMAMNAGAQSDPPPLQPVGSADASVDVYRSTIDIVGDEYQFTQVKVCSIKTTVSVYDVRTVPPNGGLIMDSPFYCETTLRNQPALVQIDGRLNYAKSFDWQTDWKDLDIGASVRLVNDPLNDKVPPRMWSVSGTRDLTQKSFVGTMMPAQSVLCSTSGKTVVLKTTGKIPKGARHCEVLNPEAFIVVFEATEK